MKRIMFAICTASLLYACNSAEKTDATAEVKSDSTAASTETKPAEEWAPIDSATAMRTMIEAGTPGKPHEMLAKANGKWTAETTVWMAPGAPPVTSKMAAVNKMILGGRYQQSSFKGDMTGMPFEGESTTGYDNTKKVYFTTWVDNMSTMMMNMEGTWDEASKSIDFRGKMICPGNGKVCEMREVYKIIDDNTHTMEMYGPDMQTGKPYKSMEIKFTKAK